MKNRSIVPTCILLLFIALTSVYAGSSHLRQRLFYVNSNGIIDSTNDYTSPLTDSVIAVENFATGMKKIVEHNGTFYHVFTDISNGNDYDVYLRTSNDGIHWNAKIRVNDDSLDVNQRYPTIAIHESNGVTQIVILWLDFRTANPQLRAAASNDGGQTWSASTPVSKHNDSTWIYGNLTVGPDGTYYAAWERQYSSSRWDETFFSKSTDGGLTWTPQVKVYSGSQYSEPCQIVAGDSGRVFIVINDDQYYRYNLVLRYSTNYGASWNTGTQLTEYPAQEGSYIPAMFVNGDSLYVLYKQYNNTLNHSQFNFLKSTDAGQSWSSAVQVNDSLEIEDLNNPGGFSLYPSITVAPGGKRIYAVWADRRETISQQNYNVYFSFSLDGGLTWSTDMQVNQDTTGQYIIYPSVSLKTNGITDTVLVVWQDDRDIPVGLADNDNALPSGFQLQQNYPNPFNPLTTIRFQLPERAYAELNIYDINGRFVKSLVHEVRAAGNNRVRFDGSHLASGVYYYKLKTAGFTLTKKMILLK